MAGLKELQEMNSILRKKIRIKKQGGKIHHRFVTGTERWIWLFSSYDIIHQSLIRNGFCVWEAVEGN